MFSSQQRFCCTSTDVIHDIKNDLLFQGSGNEPAGSLTQHSGIIHTTSFSFMQ